MKELRSIISGLSSKERKAARRYFSQKYANTKELRLFIFLEQSPSVQQHLLKEKIEELGYESIHSRSFQKLKIRLRNKLFDFLITNTSIEGSKNTDKNLFLQQRLRKLNLQANILLEKSYLNQSKEILINTARLAEENGQYDHLIDAMKELKKIHEIKANYAKKEKLSLRLHHFEHLSSRINELKEEFFEIYSRLETDFLDFSSKRIRENLLLMRAHEYELNNDIVQFMIDHLQILLYQIENKHKAALDLAISWSKRIRENPSKYIIEFKLINSRANLENLLKTGKINAAIGISDGLINSILPTHQLYPILETRLHFALIENRLDESESLLKKCGELIPHTGKMQNSLHYFKAFHFYRNKNYKAVLEIINDNMRNYSCASFQQLDFMLLEIMVLFNLNKLDLIEYRIQGFSKNLAYRKKFDLPPHYKKCSIILSNLLRLNFDFKNEKILLLYRDLVLDMNNGLLSSKSLQPDFFFDWFKSYSKVDEIDFADQQLQKALSEAIF